MSQSPDIFNGTTAGFDQVGGHNQAAVMQAYGMAAAHELGKGLEGIQFDGDTQDITQSHVGGNNIDLGWER
ncbi:MAG: hypothetical protein CMM94_06640 [Rickettsiales bacterium]|nr:hypothetical protein [Rickettsiales bacterium]|tara:strand:- start:46 stop:258 length:213 start_codon:yes stop_codon:yes gene_type:complete